MWPFIIQLFSAVLSEKDSSMICSISKSLLSWMTSIVFLGVNVTVHHSTFFGCFIWKGVMLSATNNQGTTISVTSLTTLFSPFPPCWRAASNSYPNFKSTQDMSQKRKTLWIRSLFSVQCCCSFWCRVFLYPWQYSNLWPTCYGVPCGLCPGNKGCTGVATTGDCTWINGECQDDVG